LKTSVQLNAICLLPQVYKTSSSRINISMLKNSLIVSVKFS